ncbi:MAG: OprD family outer membrane porin [Burkholderiaceae bacterium]|nr:OprD family outer membrane porin [Burkholderiaceae bacterium]
MRAPRLRPTTLSAVCGFCALLPGGAAQAQLDAASPFIRDAAAGFNARTFYMDSEDNSKAPAQTLKEAWAIGGKLFGRTGYWRDTLQFGASYYLSLPLYAPDGRDGTLLLAPGQETISVLGELYGRLKVGDTRLTLGRQEIDLGYQRASGVRSNRGDATYLGRQDNRMVPLTYQAVLLGWQAHERLNYYAGWVDKAKLRNSEDFVDAGAAIGAKGSGSDLWSGGVQFAPVKDFWVQGWVHRSSDVIRIGFVDADYVARLSAASWLRLAGQYSDQRSDGSNALTGQAFATSNTQVYAEYGLDWLSFYGTWSRTGSGADMRFPFSSGPIYTQQIMRSFTRAHESAWQLGLGTDLGRWASGLSAYVDVTRGSDAINPASGAALADATEVDAGAVWTLKQKGSAFDGLRARLRYAWVTDKTSTGDQKSSDLRIDLNLPIDFR